MIRTFTSILKMTKMKFIDIGANLTDPVYQGCYNGSKKHPPDLDKVLNRSWENGLEKIIITVGSLNEANNALNLSKTDDRLYITMGCHPTRCNEFKDNPTEYMNGLKDKIRMNPNKIIAIGEFGLDYDRLKFCDKETQKQYFEMQMDLVDEFNLPMFLHCRNSHDDFIEIIEKNLNKIHLSTNNGGGDSFGIGVVHSFDGTLLEAQKLINLGFYIGLNGCSLKTMDNLNVVKEIPSNRILIETDSPWCGIRPSHAGRNFIKTNFPTVKKKEKWTENTLIDGRNEPCQISQVLEVIAGVKNKPIEELANLFYENTIKLFFRNKKKALT